MSYYTKRFFGQQGIIKDGLKLWLDASNPASYPGSGTVWSDLSGNGNNGTMVNGVAFSGANGGVMSFDGVDDYVLNSLNKTNLGSIFTISFWIKPSSSTNTIGVMQIASGLNHGLPWILCQRNTQTTISWYLNVSYVITQNVAVDEWCFITIQRDATMWRSFKNGTATGTSTTGLGANSGNNLYIGNGYNGYFKGSQNEYLVYNRALTPSEITQNFEGTRLKYGI